MRSFEELYKPQEKQDAGLDKNGNFLVNEKNPLQIFLDNIAIGMTFNNACHGAMLLPKKVKEWLAEGEERAESEDGSKLADFYLRYKKAESDFELNKIKAIETAIANGDASKAMWQLERRLAEHYSQKQEIKMGSENLQIKVDVPNTHNEA